MQQNVNDHIEKIRNQVHVDLRAGSVYFIRSSDDIGIVPDWVLNRKLGTPIILRQ